MNNIENVYMIIGTDKKAGKDRWHTSGRGNTPFTTTNISRAKGELTRLSDIQCAKYKIVKVKDITDVN